MTAAEQSIQDLQDFFDRERPRMAGLADSVWSLAELRYAERGRTELLRSLGYHNRQLAEAPGLLFAVARAELAYLAPARLDDLLTVRTTPLGFKGVRLELAQEVWRG